VEFMEPLFQLDLQVPPRGSRQRLRALHRQIRDAILDGRLQPGLKLPPTRELARVSGVSRNTALATYDLLLSEGYLHARRGSGTYVAQIHAARPRRPASSRGSEDDPRLNPSWRLALLAARGGRRPRPRYEFRIGLPDASLFPLELWRRLTARALRALAKTPFDGVDTQGQGALREAIARHVSFARAVACRAEDIVVTTGAQQAFDLLARVLVTPKRSVVAVEEPGYAPLRAAFATAGAKVIPVPLDDEGLIVDRVPSQARVICVTPSHQYPLGLAMSMSRRAALLEFARRRGAVVIEDDYDGEYRYGGRPLDALQTLDRHESVFYVGTFGKCLFPAVRIGYIVAPPWAVRALVAMKECSDWHGPGTTQDALAAFISEGHLARHMRRMQAIYSARRKLILQSFEERFAGALEPVPSIAGLHLSARLLGDHDASAVSRRAREADVGVYDLSRFYWKKPTLNGLVFGFGTIGERDIAEALTRLQRALMRPSGRTRSAPAAAAVARRTYRSG
jgi:GntR family transcriptional regulator/MocR family aminotransferase